MSVLLLLATLAAPVPDHVQERAEAVVASVLEGVAGEVQLRLFRTRAEMEAAVRKIDKHPPDLYIAYYDYRKRTIYAWMAPRPDPVLYEGRLPGLLIGALVHEAQHARGHLTVKDYRKRPAWRNEGEADRDTVAFLRERDWPGAGAWELLAESRVKRGRRFFLEPEAFRRLDARRLPAAARATWYAQAYDMARTEPPRSLTWVLWSGSAEPFMGGYRMIAGEKGEALLVREEPGPLEIDVVPLDPGKGAIQILHGFDNDTKCDRIFLEREGGVRAFWADGTIDVQFPAPPIPNDEKTRIGFHHGTVTVNGKVVLHVQQSPGKVGVGLRDGVVDVFFVKRAS